MNELSHESALQNFYIESLCDGFVGRKTLLKQCTSVLKSHDSGILAVTGKHGSGKSSLMVEQVFSIFYSVFNLRVLFCFYSVFLISLYLRMFIFVYCVSELIWLAVAGYIICHLTSRRLPTNLYLYFMPGYVTFNLSLAKLIIYCTDLGGTHTCYCDIVDQE